MKRVDIFLPFKYQAEFVLLMKRVNIIFEVARAEIFIFHHDWAEIFLWANMRAEKFISKKYQPPPPPPESQLVAP